MAIRAVLLGVAQDAGVPQAGCTCPRCLQAWENPHKRRWVVSLGLADSDRQRFWLVDATPHFKEQLHLMRTLFPAARLAGLFLTHAHIGHYTGLIHLGREAMGAKRVPVYVSERMGNFLRRHAPWSQLVADHHIDVRVISPGEAIMLDRSATVVPVAVPHRDEWSDTLAFYIRGAHRSLFYCPDADTWQGWSPESAEYLQKANVALLDATFYSRDELPHRNLDEIPHPVVLENMAFLGDLAASVVLIHLNHSNPLLDPGDERAYLASFGVQVGQRGQHWLL